MQSQNIEIFKLLTGSCSGSAWTTIREVQFIIDKFCQRIYGFPEKDLLDLILKFFLLSIAFQHLEKIFGPKNLLLVESVSWHETE